jgi:hypothetical protein
MKTTIKGYSKLSQLAKKVFDETYAKHQLALGESEKANWQAVKVKEQRDHIRVDFANGEWLHYTAIGTWY